MKSEYVDIGIKVKNAICLFFLFRHVYKLNIYLQIAKELSLLN